MALNFSIMTLNGVFMNDIVKVCKTHGPLTSGQTVLRKRRPPIKCYLACIFCYKQQREREKTTGYWQRDEVKAKKKAYRERPEIKAHLAKLAPIRNRATNKKRYGITLEIYEKMLKKQDNKCAICHQEETRRHHISKQVRDLSIDHNHLTGKVRKLLCGHCNMIIGNLNESIPLLQSMIKYLKKHK